MKLKQIRILAMGLMLIYLTFVGAGFAALFTGHIASGLLAMAFSQLFGIALLMMVRKYA